MKRFGLNLEGVIDLYFAEQQRPHNMRLHALGLFEELDELRLAGLDPDPPWLHDLLHQLLLAFSTFQYYIKITYRSWRPTHPNSGSRPLSCWSIGERRGYQRQGTRTSARQRRRLRAGSGCWACSLPTVSGGSRSCCRPTLTRPASLSGSDKGTSEDAFGLGSVRCLGLVEVDGVLFAEEHFSWVIIFSEFTLYL